MYMQYQKNIFMIVRRHVGSGAVCNVLEGVCGGSGCTVQPAQAPFANDATNRRLIRRSPVPLSSAPVV